jgi:hypothetical protein
MEILKEAPKPVRTGRKPVHPYDEWFALAEKNPGIQLSHGEDFNCKVETLQNSLYRVGKQRGLKVKTVVIGEDNLAIAIARPETKTRAKARK